MHLAISNRKTEFLKQKGGVLYLFLFSHVTGTEVESWWRW